MANTGYKSTDCCNSIVELNNHKSF